MRSSISVLLLVAAVSSRAFARPAREPAPAATLAPAAPSGEAVPAAAVSAAAPAPSNRGATVWGILPWNGVGVGGRFTFPLAVAPLLANTSIHDNFVLEAGLDVLRWTYGQDTLYYSTSFHWTEILPVVGVSWNLWFNEHFALYPKLEAGYAFGWLSGNAYNAGGYGGVFLNGAAGALYRLDSGLTLRAEAGYSGLKLGVAWMF